MGQDQAERLDTSAFVFAGDLADEGVETVLGTLQERGGLAGITPAFVYHAARDAQELAGYSAPAAELAIDGAAIG